MLRSKSDDKLAVENLNAPGRTERADRTKYLAMRDTACDLAGGSAGHDRACG